MGLFKSIVILLPKLKPESAALEIFGLSFACLFFFNLLSYFPLFKRTKTPLYLVWSLSLGSLQEWRHESCRGEAAWEVKEGRKRQLFQEITCPCTFPHVQASIL